MYGYFFIFGRISITFYYTILCLSFIVYIICYIKFIKKIQKNKNNNIIFLHNIYISRIHIEYKSVKWKSINNTNDKYINRKI